jgi:pseudouridine-5'-phosphate glycosidase
MTGTRDFLVCSDEVGSALDEGQPVLALETTLVTHGMPWPRNFETARQAEAAAREQGATPATIAVLDGRLRVGLNAEELERLAQLGPGAAKCSRRDLPFEVARGRSAGTTVAATMIIAALAGIRVFATGGIGGVHRGAERNMDISADLQELTKTPVAVVCAGPKSILDIGLTVEYLETFGVPVVGYRVDELPAFYSRQSGLTVDYRVDSVEELAGALSTKWALDLHGGMVIANPIPEEFALPFDQVEEAIRRAEQDALKQNITGQTLTPFLLRRLEDLTGGASVRANVELILNNARLGARLAGALCALDAEIA